MPGNRTGKQTRGAARKAEIVKAAGRMISRQGFEGITIEAIAAKTQSSKETIYRHFGDRDGLITEVLGQQFQMSIKPLLNVETVTENDGTHLEELSRMYQDMIFKPEFLRVYRFLLGHVNKNPSMGQIFNTVVSNRVIEIFETKLNELIGHQIDEETIDCFLGALQGKEFNRALAGETPRTDRVTANRTNAISGLLANLSKSNPL